MEHAGVCDTGTRQQCSLRKGEDHIIVPPHSCEERGSYVSVVLREKEDWGVFGRATKSKKNQRKKRPWTTRCTTSAKRTSKGPNGLGKVVAVRRRNRKYIAVGIKTPRSIASAMPRVCNHPKYTTRGRTGRWRVLPLLAVSRLLANGPMQTKTAVLAVENRGDNTCTQPRHRHPPAIPPPAGRRARLCGVAQRREMRREWRCNDRYGGKSGKTRANAAETALEGMAGGVGCTFARLGLHGGEGGAMRRRYGAGEAEPG